MYNFNKEKVKCEKKKKPHYVNNKEFLQAMIEWNDRCKQAKKEGKQLNHQLQTILVSVF